MAFWPPFRAIKAPHWCSSHRTPDTGSALRPVRRALILDCDGYGAPIFSPDGRQFALRGNAYDNSLEVFEFPSLRRVLGLTLGEPSPGYPYPQQRLDSMHAWSRHNVAFGSAPGVLWIGTPPLPNESRTARRGPRDACPLPGL